MFVKEFGLFSTTFRRVDGQEIIAPNSLLANSKLVHNLRRCNSMYVILVPLLVCETDISDTQCLQGGKRRILLLHMTLL